MYPLTFSLQGKVKPVTERTGTAGTDLLEPTPNFDCHVSRSIQSLPANTPLSQVFDYSQVTKMLLFCLLTGPLWDATNIVV